MLTAYLYLLAILLNLVLGIFVWFRNPRGVVNRLFFGFVACVILWILALFWLYFPQWSIFLPLTAGKLSYLAGALAVYDLYLLAREFPRKVRPGFSLIDGWWSVETLILSIVTMTTELIDAGEILVDGVSVTIFGPLFNWFTLHFIVLIVWSFGLLLWKYKRLSQVEKFKLVLFFVGILLAVSFAAVTNLLLPIWGYGQFSEIGPVGTVLMAALIGYAIVWHRLLDVTLIVARAVGYFVLLLLVVGIEGVFVWGLTRVLPGDTDLVMVAMVGAVVIVLGYDGLRDVITRLTERIFFQGRYDTEKLLSQLTKIMASEIEIGALTQKLMEVIAREMRITKLAFVLVKEHRVTRIQAVGYDHWRSLEDQRLEKLLHVGAKTYVFEELADQGLQDLFRELEITVAVPFTVKENEIGLMVMGPKSSGDIYPGRDLELLEILAPQTAVALQNAESYRAIQEFSATLEKKVEERTEELKVLQARELEKAKELLRLKDEFVFIATHDLKTPIAAINGFVKLIEPAIKKLPADTKDSFEAIVEASDRLKQLVNDLLEVARSESGVIKVESKPVSMGEIIEEVVREVTPSLKAKKIKLVKPELSKIPLVVADPAKLKEVLENLLSNAVKYNQEKGEIRIEVKAVGGKIEVSVADTGYGIPEGEQSKVFSKFFRADQKEVHAVAGTGLGLFVVKMLIEKMGGGISFKSKEGEGSTFSFVLPIAKK